MSIDRLDNSPCGLCGACGQLNDIDVSGQTCNRIASIGACVVCIRLKQIDKIVEETTGCLQSVLKERMELKFKRNIHHDLMVTRLPVELITRIFALSIAYTAAPTPSNERTFPSRVCENHENPSPPRGTPWDLAIVCRTWHDIVWSTPHLWTSVAISVSRHDFQYPQFVREWFSRSGRLPLSLTIYEKPQGEGTHFVPEQANLVIDAANQNSYRWKNLDLAVCATTMQLITGDLSGKSSLKRLQISRCPINCPLPCFRMTHVIPNPTTVFLDGDWKAIQIAWDQVKQIEITGRASGVDRDPDWPWYINGIDLLQCASSITSLTLCFLTFDMLDLGKTTITHSSLQKLKLFTNFGATQFLDVLTLPSLEELSITGGYLAVSHLVNRSQCRIKRLMIQYDEKSSSWDSSESDILSLLDGTPALTDLTISGALNVANTLLSRFTSAPQFLPVLRSLGMSCHQGLEWRRLVNVLKNHGRELRSLEIAVLGQYGGRTRNERIFGEGVGMRHNSWDARPIPKDVVTFLKAVRRTGAIDITIVNEHGDDMILEEEDKVRSYLSTVSKARRWL